MMSVALVVSAVGPGSAQAQDDREDPDYRLAMVTRPVPAATAGADAPADAPAGAETEPLEGPAGLIEASRYVFQSYRDNNWEVYTVKGDGSALTRVTAHGASDVGPRLNRGASRIVYASNRTGNYDIFAMGVDGSGLVQLTSHPADDAQPVWSPDGTRIAFTSYRDGQAEVYVMNADGSAQTRLTAANGYDASPTWSPDGSRIAFVSARSGGYRIWRMAADGSQAMQLSNQPYSFDPVWSPDGRQIAYDSDADQNGWQSLWVMNLDGSNAREMRAPSQAQTDLLAGSWSPDSQRVALTRVNYVYENNAWYWDTAYLDSIHMGNLEVQAISSLGLDWNPDWATTDIYPPSTSVSVLPAYSPASGITVRWGGFDNGASGIASYDIQLRSGPQSAWGDWQSATTATSADYPGSAGNTIQFRGRARDVVGNLEPWSDTFDASTTFYDVQLTGVVRDARGQPVSDAALSSTPAALANAVSDSSGVYALPLSTQNPIRLAVTHPGFGVPAPRAVNVASSTSLDLYLPPPSDLLLNGDFESLGWGGWSPGGSVTPTVSSAAALGGSRGLRLGQDALIALPERLGPAPAYNSIVAPAVGPDGSLSIISWAPNDMLYRTDCPVTAPCGAATLVTDNGEWPSAAVDSAGRLHLVWLRNRSQIMYARAEPNQPFGPAQQLATIQRVYGPRLAVDGANRPHLVWDDQQTIYYAEADANGVWSAPLQLSTSGGCVSATLAVGTSGDVQVVWGAYGGGYIRYRQRIGGVWSAIETRDAAVSALPEMAVDHQGGVHVTWIDAMTNYVVHYAHRTPGGTWEPSQTIGSGTYPQRAPVAVQADDRVVVTWTALDLQWLTARDLDGSWSTPQRAFGQSAPLIFDATLRPDPTGSGVSLILQSRPNAPSDALWRRTVTVGPERSGASQVQQTVSLPAGSPQLTLGLLYRYRSDDTPGAEPLLITLQTLTGTVPLATIATPTTDTHAWFDLSPWAGQTVTVSFEVTSVANGLRSSADLDDVVVGSAYTPALTGVSPQGLDPFTGGATTLTVTGERFNHSTITLNGIPLASSTWIDAQTVQAIVPPSLAPGLYTVRVVNPDGATARWPEVIRIGRPVLLPSLWRGP